MFKSEANPQFRTNLAETTFNNKYKHSNANNWDELCETLVAQVMTHPKISEDLRQRLITFMKQMKFIPGGRYLYYAGRSKPFFNNCYLLRSEEDTREDWANLAWKAESCLLTGGGIGNDYTAYRPSRSIIRGTGGFASGPIPKM